ncbi:Protein N-acetyltransferase, RimJ/RimL family [Fontimonas thermophila]|uniref:Protein N-acetyltransferase, RimJ/RimL family n=1 Tax=Fontimonas thermophila TaxID=1076937 RepID=A0A1I2JGF0_9GAMM|nr:GNAT family N-acetyltransferase [Fontimonas thermophila]SFF51761.1 Protein N-acetyltransferase, RimJ/RimL family [Fontimonas thermophila]
MLLSALRTPRLPGAFKYTLDDGLPILVRPVRPEDAPRLREGFRRMSQLARRRRLPGIDPGATELSDEVLRRLTGGDGINHVAWGALDIEKPDEPGVGVARYIRINGEPDAADVAIVIADEYQGRGAGFVLQACLHLCAHANGIRRFYYDVASDNERILRHLKLLGAQHAGRADNIDRLVMPVYHRAWDVPDGNDIARRFAAVFRRLQRVEALTG